MIKTWAVGNNSWSSNFNDTKLLTCGWSCREQGTVLKWLTGIWEMLKEEEIMTTTTT